MKIFKVDPRKTLVPTEIAYFKGYDEADEFAKTKNAIAVHSETPILVGGEECWAYVQYKVK